MLEIYKSLQNVGIVWKTIDTYHLKCRYKSDTVIKFDIQLYKVEDTCYLVDFKNTVNTDERIQPVYPFLDVCSQLIADIVT